MGGEKSSRRRRRDRSESPEDDRRPDERKQHKRRSRDEDEDRHSKKKQSRKDDDEDRRSHKKYDDDEKHDRKRHKKSRRQNDESSSDDDRKKSRKRRHKDDEESLDEDRKSSSRKHHRHKKHRREKDAEERSKKKEKKSKKEKSDRKKPGNCLISLGEPLGSPPEKLLDPEQDYFAYHEHLWVYMYREHSLAFNDMTAEETRKAFRTFVEKYNSGELAKGYYAEKLPAGVLEESKTTNHSWSFKISESEGRSLQSIEAGVRKQTEYRDPNAPPKDQSAAPTREEGKPSPDEWVRERTVNRRLKEHVRVAEEEFSGGRKEGRERQIEKRRETGARIHGAAKDREAAAGVPDIPDDTLYEGDDRKQLARAKERAAKRQESRGSRLTELQAKEKERQEAMFKQLGLGNMKPGQKITIQPRKDGE